MCVRLFVRTTDALPLTQDDVDDAVVYVHAFDRQLSAVAEVFGGGQLCEVGAYDGCACGFGACALPGGAPIERHEQLAAIEETLSPEARADLEMQASACRALAALLEPQLDRGPVRLFASWYGHEQNPVLDRRAKRISDLTSELQPFPQHVLFTLMR